MHDKCLIKFLKVRLSLLKAKILKPSAILKMRILKLRYRIERSKMNNYPGQYGYMFPMQPNYAWDYESPVNDFNGQYGYSANSTPGCSAQWGASQMQTPSHDSSYWYNSRESISQPRYQPPTPTLNQYCDVAFTDEHTYSIHLDTERHIRNFKRSFNTTEDRRSKGKSRSDYRRNNRNRKSTFYCEDCKRSFQRKEQYLDHITAEGHMKKSDRIKNESDDGETKKVPRRTDYCDVCDQSFQNGRHFYAHLKWKKHKRLCRVAKILRGQLKKTPEEVANDPLGSFTLYMNKDCSVPYGNYGDCKEVELDAGNAFLQKFLDLKHLISQEPNPVGEEFIQEQVYNTRDLEYSCSLCKMDLVGADDIENHLRTHNHQKKYKEKFNLEQFAFEEEMKLSVSDSVFAVWKTCQSRASKVSRYYLFHLGISNMYTVCLLTEKKTKFCYR
ncbi:zinc finger protein [Schistosoma japonicum]|nr:zinc finger protein [Schistosoma japonicum]